MKLYCVFLLLKYHAFKTLDSRDGQSLQWQFYCRSSCLHKAWR